MSFNRLDRNANTPERQRRNWQRLAAKGSATGTILVNPPITTSSTGLGLAFATSTGLGLVSSTLAILFADGTITGSSTGIKVGTIAESQVTNLVSDLAGKAPASRLINTTTPLQGGGDLSADRTLSIVQADATHNGYTSSTDWNTFNNKRGATPLTTKGDIDVFSTVETRLPVGTDGQVLTADSTQTTGLKWNTSSGSATATLKNKVINGDFRIWQRGTSFSANGYAADRWKMVGAGGIGTTTKQLFTLGQTAVPGEPTSYLEFQLTVAGPGPFFPQIGQSIEGVRTLAGQQATLSFYAKASATVAVIAQLQQHFGTGGSPSADINNALSGTVNLTTSWARYSVTGTLPSITGKTIGTNGDDVLVVALSPPVSTTFTIDFANVQVEAGGSATDFEYLPLGLETLLCKRYYHKSYTLDTVPGTVTDNGDVAWFAGGVAGEWAPYILYPAEMRVAPTRTFYSPNSGTSGKKFNASDAVDETMTGVNISSNNSHSGGTNGVANKVYRYQFTADADY